MLTQTINKGNNADMYNVLVQAPVPICIVKELDYTIEFANDYYLQALGKDKKVIGQPFFESFPELKKQGLIEIINTVIASGIPYHINETEVFVSRNSKEEQSFFNCIYQPFKEASGTITGVIVIFTEVTEQVLLKKINLDYQQKLAIDLTIANNELAFQKEEKRKRADELGIANIELAFQGEEKVKRADELGIANIQLAYQDDEKVKRADELIIANKELIFQNSEKEKRADELIISNKELIESEKLLKSSLKEISDYQAALDVTTIIAITNDKGIIIKANNNFCEISQYSENELIGQDHRIINSGYHTKDFMKDLWCTISSGKIWKGEIRNKAKDGTCYWVDTTIIPFLNEDGKPYQYLAIRVDISNRKESEEQLKIVNNELAYQNEEIEKRAADLRIANYARSLIEASLDPLFTINNEGKITDINNASLNITGKTRNELIGSDFFKYFTKPDKAREGYQQVFANGFVADYPLTIRDHKLTDVLFNGSIYKDEAGNVLGVVVVARDITEQKKIATELTEAKIFAEHAQGKAEEATRIAEDAVKAKQQFLSNMSHEIRTPMNAIIGFTKVVLKTELSAKQKEYISAIKTSGDALIVLINDILDLAKVDAGKMSFERTPFKMATSISAMLHLFETKIQERNLDLLVMLDNAIPEVLLGDSVRLHQIILNLVSNAVKFTDKGKITVSVKLLSQDADNVTIQFAVADTGIGIIDEKIDTIFENFQQASSSTARLYGGTGLGLAIVKQLVEAQGGSITVQSKLHEGSVFSFILPYKKTNEVTVTEADMTQADIKIKNIKVLVVEDMPLNQLLMKTILDDFGFEKEIAENGRVAVEKVQKNVYDIILMDLQMPEMNGFDATEYIRNTLKSQIPIIALTADVTTADLKKCMAVGMNDYIAKPVDDQLLYSKMITVLKKAQDAKSSIAAAVMVSEVMKERYINMDYLLRRTKANPVLIMEMITLYLEQTPPLVALMKQSLETKDWQALHAAVHKMIPSFAIMGINAHFENMAKQIQEYANTQLKSEGIHELVLQLENVCVQVCKELEEEFNRIKNNN
jgi:PAS domain S-box-containing protein